MRKLTLILLILAAVFVGCEKEETKPSTDSYQPKKVVYKHWIIQLVDSCISNEQGGISAWDQHVWRISNQEAHRIDSTYALNDKHYKKGCNYISVNLEQRLYQYPAPDSAYGYLFSINPVDSATGNVIY